MDTRCLIIDELICNTIRGRVHARLQTDQRGTISLIWNDSLPSDWMTASELDY
jgi:hypothetical protein